jgi:hypothetical protein
MLFHLDLYILNIDERIKIANDALPSILDFSSSTYISLSV